MPPSISDSCAVGDSRAEYHLHDDYSLTPAYVLGYAFHALQRIDAGTPVHGRRGVVALLGEVLATMGDLGLTASLAAAEPLRIERDALARNAHSPQTGMSPATRVISALAVVEDAVRAELHARGSDITLVPQPGTRTLRVLLGDAALARCPDGLRVDLTEACRALDAHLYTASVFHSCRVWDQLAGAASPTRDDPACIVADPRADPGLYCSRADAAGLLGAIRMKLEAM